MPHFATKFTQIPAIVMCLDNKAIARLSSSISQVCVNNLIKQSRFEGKISRIQLWDSMWYTSPQVAPTTFITVLVTGIWKFFNLSRSNVIILVWQMHIQQIFTANSNVQSGSKVILCFNITIPHCHCLHINQVFIQSIYHTQSLIH